jgi:hypothetical protein
MDLFNCTCPHCGQPMPDQASGDFAEFWAAYPKRKGRKVGRAQAEKQYARSKAPHAVLMAAVRSYAAKCGEYPKDAFRWLRDENWRDEDVKAVTGQNKIDRAAMIEKMKASPNPAIRRAAEDMERKAL